MASSLIGEGRFRTLLKCSAYCSKIFSLSVIIVYPPARGMMLMTWDRRLFLFSFFFFFFQCAIEVMHIMPVGVDLDLVSFVAGRI